jgi:hypothetical protein
MITPTDHISSERLYPLFRNTSGAKYAGVPTTERRNDFSPIILANPKSQSYKIRKKIFHTFWNSLFWIKKKQSLFTKSLKLKYSFLLSLEDTRHQNLVKHFQALGHNAQSENFLKEYKKN